MFEMKKHTAFSIFGQVVKVLSFLACVTNLAVAYIYFTSVVYAQTKDYSTGRVSLLLRGILVLISVFSIVIYRNRQDKKNRLTDDENTQGVDVTNKKRWFLSII